MRVSVIIPSYNAASFITQTVRSVQAQTYQDWELLIADDCSTDNSRDIIVNLGKSDSRICLIKCEKNAGPASARNAALAQMTGRYIAFLDSDDIWLPEKLEKSIKTAQDQEASLVCTGFRRFTVNNNGTQSIGRYMGVASHYSYSRLLGGNEIATSTVLIDTQKTGSIKMQPVYYDDFDCWLSILKRDLRIVGLNEDLMRYRVLPGSISRNKLRSAYHHWDSLRRLQRLSLLSASWYFTLYAIRGIRKYIKL